jgi:hypothetical protein
MLHELGWPIDLTNRIITYSRVYGITGRITSAFLA